MRYLYFILILAATIGCDKTETTETSTEQQSSVVQMSMLSSDMDDAAILKFFGLDIDAAVAQHTQGKDGKRCEYTYGSSKVTIVRSAVSGLSINATGTDPEGSWSFPLSE